MLFPGLSSYAVFLILSGATSFFFTVFGTLSGVYRIQVVGLGPLELVLVGTVLEATVFLFELPTGVAADRFGRRPSVITGMFLIGAGFIIEGSLPVLGAVLLAQVVWGLGATFESGASEAWIADEVGEALAGAAFMRASQVGALASMAGIGVSVALGNRWLGLPLVAGGLGFMATGAFLLLCMGEPGFRPEPRNARGAFASMGQTLLEGLGLVHRRPVLLSILVIAAIAGASSETFDRLWEAHLLTNFRFPEIASVGPLAWFGFINAVALLLGAAVTEAVRRRVKTDSHLAVARALLVLNTLLVFSVAAFGLAGRFWVALAFYWASVLLRRVNGPLFRAWLNQGLPARVRATVFSLANQLDALGQIAGGPLLGLVAATAGLRPAFVAAGLVLVPATLLYFRSLRHARGPAPKDEAVL